MENEEEAIMVKEEKKRKKKKKSDCSGDQDDYFAKQIPSAKSDLIGV